MSTETDRTYRGESRCLVKAGAGQRGALRQGNGDDFRRGAGHLAGFHREDCTAAASGNRYSCRRVRCVVAPSSSSEGPEGAALGVSPLRRAGQPYRWSCTAQIGCHPVPPVRGLSGTQDKPAHWLQTAARDNHARGLAGHDLAAPESRQARRVSGGTNPSGPRRRVLHTEEPKPETFARSRI